MTAADPELLAAARLATALFDRLEDSPFFIKDAALVYVAANPAMARLCGVRDPAALVGRTAAAFFPRPEAERYEALDAAVLAGGRPIADRLDYAAGRGRAGWLLFSRVPVHAGDGRVVGVAASARRLGDAERQRPALARLARAVAWAEAALDRPFDLAALAGAAGASPAQVERDFKAAFGTGPRAFVARLRLDRARTLLAGGEPVAAVAQACGFSDQSAFTRRFRALTGTTPRAFARQQQERR